MRHNFKIKRDDENYHVQLAHCKVDLGSGRHTYRKKTLEEIAFSLQNQSDNSRDPPDHPKHLPCHRDWKSSGTRQPVKGH